jgi:hypothetical protein
MANSNQMGATVSSNFIWDIQQIQQTQADPLLKELLIRMYQNIALMATVLNVKTTGQYVLNETPDGNLWFPNPANNSSTTSYPAQRAELQKVYLVTNVGAGATTVAHGIKITALTTITRLYGAASDQVGFNYYEFNSGAGAANISVIANNVNIVITNNTGITFTTVYIVLKYLQS